MMAADTVIACSNLGKNQERSLKVRNPRYHQASGISLLAS